MVYTTTVIEPTHSCCATSIMIVPHCRSLVAKVKKFWQENIFDFDLLKISCPINAENIYPLPNLYDPILFFDLHLLQATAASLYGDVLSEDRSSSDSSKNSPSFSAWRT